MPTARNNWNSGNRRTTTANRSWTTGRTTWTGTRGGYGTTGSTNSSKTATNRGYSPTSFNAHRREVQAKIGSFRTINEQFSGATQVKAFSPTTATRWINYVNTGCNIYKFNTNEFCRFFGWQFNSNTCSPNTAMRTLRSKFGTGVKAVTRGKGNCWLVAATPRVNGRPFSTYNW